MYQIAIVDDEDIIREGLKRVVEWSRLGFDIAGAFSSAEELLGFIADNSIDVVLVDIRLPRKSGLDLITAVRAVRPAMRFVILSGYDSFQYAQRAIDLNVFAYLLKPVKTAEVIEVFTRLHAALDRDYTDRNRRIVDHQARIARGLCENQPTATWEEHWAALVQRHQWLNRAGWHLLLVDIHIDVQPVEHSSVVSAPDSIRWNCVAALTKRLTRDDRLVLGGATERGLVLCCKTRRSVADAEGEIAEEVKAVSTDRSFVAFSAAALVVQSTSAEGLRATASAAEERIKTRLTEGVNRVLVGPPKKIGTAVPPPFDDASSAMECAVRLVQNDETGLLKGLERAIDTVFDFAGNDIDIVRAHLVRFFYEMEEQLKPYGVSLSACGAKVEDFMTTVLVIPFSQEIRRRLETVLVAALACYRRIHDRPHNHVVSAALEIITRRFGSELTLESVAEEIQVSPSHLSRLFRHVLNETFKEHLTGVRISEARRRLVDTNDKVYQIADAVGFPDQRYFSEVFRKQTGMTPVQYRNRRGEYP